MVLECDCCGRLYEGKSDQVGKRCPNNNIPNGCDGNLKWKPVRLHELLSDYEQQCIKSRLGNEKDFRALLQLELLSPLGKECGKFIKLVKEMRDCGLERNMQTLLEEIVINTMITWFFG